MHATNASNDYAHKCSGARNSRKSLECMTFIADRKV